MVKTIIYGYRLILLVYFAVALSFSSNAQVIRSIEYLDHIVIDKKVSSENLGGLSGITFNKQVGQYLVAADKPPSRIFSLTLKMEHELSYELNQTLQLKPSPLSEAELEGIAFDEQRNSYFVSDEQSDGTRIFEIDNSGGFKRIVYPLNAPFLPLSGHNSGIEGLSISEDDKSLYFAFERSARSCIASRITTIGKLSLEDSAVESFAYELHTVENDNLNNNGISDILFLNDSTILVMERAYIPGQGNVVRLFETILVPSNSTAMPLICDGDMLNLSKTTLLFDFANVDGFKIDNAEGMTFNEDKSILYIVTDDNFSSKQETQLVALSIQWNQ